MHLFGESLPAPWEGATRVVPGKRSAAQPGVERSPHGRAPEGREDEPTGSMDLSPFQGYFLVFPGTPGYAPLARGYPLAPLRGSS